MRGLKILISQGRIRDTSARRYLRDRRGHPDYFTGQENQAETQRG